ncbi:FAD/NAD(P)-binding protein [Burkholderia cenocepacia]|uniref:FAD/NAD(P)-binding protein n=1 Tax=Burkholderia cenocepacia TaxID=95486 RepID=UPI00222E8A0D|nr:FAD/NAD(P)-binding protein [Burkholderia cenocepacia]MCW3663131.1 FAD/NAD(P)-binding protein [Burkholderia cenocepacia]MDR8072888.1 FAD/NAD(P)-binding protein [Burkholderia cenocepacia]MDS0804595.1 FAD/NAD(P)-binding protein [Burkholderia cenocepacia]
MSTGRAPSTRKAVPFTIAVIGCGPRGISVLERIAARLANERNASPVIGDICIYVVDAHEIGGGRIWRPDQPSWLLMNTPAKETTIFSGPPDGGDVRPMAGPSLAEWWAEVDSGNAEPNGLAPRYVYGKYLKFAFDRIINDLSRHADVRVIRGAVIDVQKSDRRRTVMLSDRSTFDADKVVLATGHPVPELSASQLEFSLFARQHPGLRYIEGNSAADMQLSAIQPGERVGVIGCGLAFYDVMASLTEGRGGRYETAADGDLVYIPSGKEPRIHAGSRSGVPFPARATNEKAADYQYTPRLLTESRMQQIRLARVATKLDFRRDVLPWLEGEMQLVYFACILRETRGRVYASGFVDAAVNNVGEDIDALLPKDIIRKTAESFGAHGIEGVDLEKWSRPFAGKLFRNAKEYSDELEKWIRNDIENAGKGNVRGAVKAATDVLRDIRPILKYAVDYAGLTPASHQHDFLGSFVGIYSMLSAGPPAVRLKQVLALIHANILTFAGPKAEFSVSVAEKAFVVSSPQVSGDVFRASTLVDARIPPQNVHADSSPLFRNLLASGTVTSFTNSLGQDTFDTGGVAVTRAPFNAMSREGPDSAIHVIGIPVEHTRWLMQFGSGRPGPWGQFTKDADAVAESVIAAFLGALAATNTPVVADNEKEHVDV